MKQVVVIGGGASGIIAAIFAAMNGNKVKILERNSSPLKKLLITGNGKCNYFNNDMELKYFNSSNLECLNEIINEKNVKEILSFFDTIGIVPKIKDGYYYPFSGISASIKEALLIEAKLNDIEIVNDFLVEEIIKEGKFIINPNKEKIKADSIVIACGGVACPKTGSDGIGFDLASKFNHTVIKPLPALVKLKGHENYFKDWDKIRSNVKISLYEDGHFVKKQDGELQFTSSGISGICAFNLSGIIARGLNDGKKEEVKINFIPWNKKDVLDMLEERSEMVTGRTISEFLEGFMHYKLVKIILDKSKINPYKYYEELNGKEKYALGENLTNFNLEITEVGTLEEAQVSSGGVSLLEINPLTMESIKENNLFFVGEVLDVYGDCGGYNLGFAFISGMLAGKAIKWLE